MIGCDQVTKMMDWFEHVSSRSDVIARYFLIYLADFSMLGMFAVCCGNHHYFVNEYSPYNYLGVVCGNPFIITFIMHFALNVARIRGRVRGLYLRLEDCNLVHVLLTLVLLSNFFYLPYVLEAEQISYVTYLVLRIPLAVIVIHQVPIILLSIAATAHSLDIEEILER